MILRRKTEDQVRREWLQRTLFTAGEEALATPLIVVSMLNKMLTESSDLEQVVQLINHLGGRINHQISLLDASNPDPSKARYLVTGAYRTGMVTDGGSVNDIPNAIQRDQAVEDYFMARTLDMNLYSKIQGWIDGRRLRYDRILVPIQNKNVNLLVSAFWHDGEPYLPVRVAAGPESGALSSLAVGQARLEQRNRLRPRDP